MKILYFSPHPHHDIVSDVGYSVHQLEMIKAFRELGHEVELLIMGGESKEELPDYVKEPGQSTFRKAVKSIVPRVLWNTLRDYQRYIKHDEVAYARLKEKCKSFQPDVIYERSEYLLQSGVRLAQDLKIPHILEVNAPFIEEWKQFEGGNLLEKTAHKREAFKLRNTSLVSCISTTLRDQLWSTYSLDPNMANVIVTNGADPKRFGSEGAQQATSKFPLNAEKVVIGFVGSIMPYHRVDQLIRAFEKLPNEVRDRAQLLIVGGGSTLDDLKDSVSDSDAKDQVIFTGHLQRSDVPPFIDLMDICVLPSTNWYCSPIKLFEYAILGKAIIAPNTAPVTEVFTDGQNIHLVGNEQGLVKALNELILSPEKTRQLGDRAKDLILAEYQWTKLASKTLEALPRHA